MAHDDHGDSGHPGGVLDLKTVLGGLGTCLVLVAGLAWGLISAQHTEDEQRRASTDSKQWEGLRDLRDQAIRREMEVQQLRKDVDQLKDDHERFHIQDRRR